MLSAIGSRAFRPERALNAAVFDSVMVGIATHLMSKPPIVTEFIASAYKKLLTNPDYLTLVSQSTSDQPNVEERLALAKAEFAAK